MAHPFQEHKAHKVSRSRVGHIMKSGGHPHSDAAADKKLFKELIAKHHAAESRAPGRKHGGRLDKYARGGRTKDHGKHQVNIAIVNPKGHEGAGAGPMPAPGAAPPPHPPMAAPPMMPPPGGGGPAGPMPGMPPGGMPGRPPFKRGGKVKGFAKGGKIGTLASVKGMKAGADSGIGRLQKIHVYGSKSGRRKQAR